MQVNSYDGILDIKGDADGEDSAVEQGGFEVNFEGHDVEDRRGCGPDSNSTHEDKESSGTESGSGADYREDESIESVSGEDAEYGAESDCSEAVQSQSTRKPKKFTARAFARAFMLQVRVG